MEELKNCLPERIVVYLNEQKVHSLSEASVSADKFVLTHKSISPACAESKPAGPAAPSPSRPTTHQTRPKDRQCFYCHQPGHLVSECYQLKRKQATAPHTKPTTGVGLVHAVRPEKRQMLLGKSMDVPGPDRGYEPFIFEGFVSLTGDDASRCPVRVLRDTGAAQSFILSDVLPFSKDTYCGSSVLVQGIEMGVVSVPLHFVNVRSELVSGLFRVGVHLGLPVKGVTFVMGNDIAGGKVTPVLEMLDTSDQALSEELAQRHPHVFPACPVTRAQARRMGDVIDLSKTVLTREFEEEDSLCAKPLGSEKQPRIGKQDVGCVAGAVQLPATREQLVVNQKGDKSLTKCFSSVVSAEDINKTNTAYFLDCGLLMRRWTSHGDAGGDWSAVYQIVVPTAFRQTVLSLSHDHPWPGHLGVTKTHDRVLWHFFWPGLKRDVALYGRTCHACQVTGKPNQVIPPAPLCPIPAIGEPFEHVVVDCVGPLPKTKAGNQFLVTIMCVSTRYPEAIPLRRITAPVVSKALIKFFTTFGLPKVVQTDQGSNFLSRLFKQVLKTLSITHRVSSAYHPVSGRA